MENLIILAILVVIVGFAARYVYKSKKSGRKCIGCPDGSCNCSSHSGTACCCGANAAQCNCGCDGTSSTDHS